MPGIIYHGDLGEGDTFVDNFVRILVRITKQDQIDADIIRTAQGLRGNTAFQTVQNVFRHVVDTMPYVYDPELFDYVKSAKYTVAGNRTFGNQEYGDCDDMTLAAGTLLMNLGFKVRYKVIAWRVYDFTHIFLEVLIPRLEHVKNGKIQTGAYWIPLDPVNRIGFAYAGFGWEKSPVRRFKLYKVN